MAAASVDLSWGGSTARSLAGGGGEGSSAAEAAKAAAVATLKNVRALSERFFLLQSASSSDSESHASADGRVCQPSPATAPVLARALLPP